MSDAFLSITATLPLPPAVRTEYSDELAAKIIARIAEGDILPNVCRQLGLDRGTVRRWRLERAQFGEAYELALQLRAESNLEAQEQLCAAVIAGKAKIDPKSLSAVLNNMQWRAMVMNRSRYGQKAELAVTGGLTLGINTKWRGREPIEVEGERAA